MRTEKIEFNRDVGNVEDNSWISISDEGDQSYELSVRTDLSEHDQNYTEWNRFLIDDYSLDPIEAKKSEEYDQEYDGIRKLYPGTSEEVSEPFSLGNSVHKGFLGELQAASIYDRVSEHIDTNHIGLYDFVEWYEDQPSKETRLLFKYGPENCFMIDNSGMEASLENFIEEHEMDGAQLKSSLTDEVIAELDEREKSILRQSDLESVNGILTQNPEKVEKMVDGK